MREGKGRKLETVISLIASYNNNVVNKKK